jgi:imidazoleglycerol phosphate synthase cyclase subunit
VVKGVKFQGLRDAGCPVELAKKYEEQGADELVFLDVSATIEGRDTHAKTVAKIREVLSIPLTTGGGVREPAHARKLLDAGADKVSTNTAAVDNPSLINQMAEEFGRQCTILAIDAARREDDSGWEVVTHSGKTRTGRCAIKWAVEASERGAGEILLTSWDRDGTRSGYDLELLKVTSQAVTVPIIASGGANSPQHLCEAMEAGSSAVLAASIFHDGDYTVAEVKEYLRAKGLEVRL